MAFPVVEATAESATITAGTNHVVTLPSGIVSGDLLIIVLDKGSTSATVNDHADWTELLDEASANGLYIAYRRATGGESNPTLVTSASTRSAEITYRISGAINPATQAPETGTTATGTSVSPNPPALTPTGGAKSYLWIALFGGAGEEADDDTWSDTPPTSFLPSPPLQKACGIVGTNLGGKIAAASYAANAASQDPGTFAQDVSTAWRAQTIAIHPAPSVPRLNLVDAPSFEVATGWLASGAATVTRETGQAHEGTYGLKVVTTAAAFVGANSRGWSSGTFPVPSITGSSVYTFSAWIYAEASAVGNGLSWNLAEYGVGYIRNDQGSLGSLSLGWQRITSTHTTDSTCTHIDFDIFTSTAWAGTFWIDSLMVEYGSALGDYFDGDSVIAGYTASWDGTAHASTSRLVVNEPIVNMAPRIPPPRADRP